MPSFLEMPVDSGTFDDFRNRNETELTYSMKWAAWKWLWEVAECRLIGFEVRLEGPFGRIADVVGLGPENRVFLIEVKSSRSDLRRDDNNERTREKLVAKSKSLDAVVELTKSVLSAASRSAQNESAGGEGGSGSLRSRAVSTAEVDVRTFARKSDSTKKRIENLSTKFHDAAYLRCADYHYIMAPHRMFRTTELPEQWGLLNQRTETVVEAPLKQVKRVTQHVMRAIGRSNTRDLMKACEVRVARD